MILSVKSVKQFIVKGLIQIIVLILLIYLVFPFIWLLSISFKSTPEIVTGGLKIIPENLYFDHYRSIIHDSNLNSLLVSILSMTITLLIALPAAYSLVRYKTKIKNAVLGWILASQIFPAILIIIPLYTVLRYLHLTDSIIGLTMVYVVWELPFVLWMLYGYIKSIPLELEEAAFIDGATKLQYVYRILFPVILPAIGATAIFAFIISWNEFLFALVLMKNPENITLPVQLSRFTGMEGQARIGLLAAASCFATIPSLVLFTFLRKGFKSGLISGAVKV
jgi:multiple sugar transport system permease protein